MEVRPKNPRLGRSGRSRAAGKPFKKVGGEVHPSYRRVSRPPGAALTPEIDDLRSVQKSRNIKNLGVRSPLPASSQDAHTFRTIGQARAVSADGRPKALSQKAVGTVGGWSCNAGCATRVYKKVWEGVVNENYYFKFSDRFPAEVGPGTPLNGSGPKNGAERTQN